MNETDQAFQSMRDEITRIQNELEAIRNPKDTDPADLAMKIAAQIGNIFDDEKLSSEEHRKRVDLASRIAQKLINEAVGKDHFAFDILLTIRANTGAIAQESGTDILWVSKWETFYDWLSSKIKKIDADQPDLPLSEREATAEEFLSLLVGGHRFTENEIMAGVTRVREKLANGDKAAS